MARVRRPRDGRQPPLFDLPPSGVSPVKIKSLEHPIWTENKAKLIECYLFLFEMVTKHGTYIDGFAGPQRPKEVEMWAAKLVLGLKPQWLRHFYLFEKKRVLYDKLNHLKRMYKNLDVQVFPGDFNYLVLGLLHNNTIREKEATFCLLDHRTFECNWSTVKALANYKTKGPKIELFYFLPYFWIDRALSAQKKTEVLDKWWGSGEWKAWKKMRPEERKDYFAQRFKNELGYRYSVAWPVYRRKHGGNIMYHMIHATDHAAAPILMSRAYDQALDIKETAIQLKFDLQRLS
ncbi:MAG: three-Cys-motif partner protein TcmP [Deltaproteobacteria bacterium]|nr:three-Cys-motif partner protein TcmP [Deltaproteobacteria bacterium]